MSDMPQEESLPGRCCDWPRALRLLGLVTLPLYLLDQATKLWTVKNFSLGEQRHVSSRQSVRARNAGSIRRKGWGSDWKAPW